MTDTTEEVNPDWLKSIGFVPEEKSSLVSFALRDSRELGSQSVNVHVVFYGQYSPHPNVFLKQPGNPPDSPDTEWNDTIDLGFVSTREQLKAIISAVTSGYQ